MLKNIHFNRLNLLQHFSQLKKVNRTGQLTGEKHVFHSPSARKLFQVNFLESYYGKVSEKEHHARSV